MIIWLLPLLSNTTPTSPFLTTCCFPDLSVIVKSPAEFIATFVVPLIVMHSFAPALQTRNPWYSAPSIVRFVAVITESLRSLFFRSKSIWHLKLLGNAELLGQFPDRKSTRLNSSH